MLPHTGKRDGIPSGAATGRNCRRFDNLLDAEQKRDDGAWLVLCYAIREASLRAQALGLALRASFRPEVWLIWYKFPAGGVLDSPLKTKWETE